MTDRKSADGDADDERAAVELARQAAAARELLVVTGAGVSLASGIPTFRGSDPGAVWKRDTLEMATRSFFLEDPVESWRWYLSRFETLIQARPNPAHRAIADLERIRLARGLDLLLVTQNIDTLHEQGGSTAIVKVHGSSDRVRCPAPGCRVGAPRGSMPRPDDQLRNFLEAPSADRLPRCPECESILRPHVLWFDEFYDEHVDYQWTRVQRAAMTADVVWFVGTSFSVGVTDLIAHGALSRGASVVSIDPGAAPPPYRQVAVIRAAAEELLPRVVAAMA